MDVVANVIDIGGDRIITQVANKKRILKDGEEDPLQPFSGPFHIASMQFTKNMPQSSVFLAVYMSLFQNQRPPPTQPSRAFMLNQFGSYIPMTLFISTNNEERSRDHSEDASSHGSMSSKMLIKLDRKE